MNIRYKNSPRKVLVSVVVNCYNGERYLAGALESILNQTYGNIEIIFYDNLSTDNSFQIARDLAEVDSRLKCFRAKCHTHLGKARADAIDLISGDILTFLDVDDRWYNFKIEKQVEILSTGNYEYCFAGSIRKSQSGQFLGTFIPSLPSGLIFKDLVRTFHIDILSPAILVKAMKKSKIKFNSEIKSSEEVNFFLRFSIFNRGFNMGEVVGESMYRTDSLTNVNAVAWSSDLEITIDQLVKENKSFKTDYASEYEYLTFKVGYLSAKAAMMNDNYAKAKNAILGIPSRSKFVILLIILIYIPPLWKIIHHAFDKFIFLRHNKFVQSIFAYLGK